MSSPTRLAYAAAAAATVAGAVTHRRDIQAVAKPLLMPILAVHVGAHREPLRAAGLVAATLGDIAMIDPDDDARFTTGASSFGIMQACWSILLQRRGSRMRAVNAVPRAAGWAVGAAVAVRRAPSIAAVSTAYGVALGTMSALGADGDTPAVVGSALFTISDALVLARRTVASPRVKDGLEVAVLLTYVAAQYALVTSFARPTSLVGPTSPSRP